MDENRKPIQETKEKLREMFSHAENRCVETVLEGSGDHITISAGYTSAGKETIEDSYFRVTGDHMFPEYVHGMDSLAKLVCNFDQAIREQEEHTVDGFYVAQIKAGHPQAVSPEDILACRCGGLPGVCEESC